MNRNYEPTHLDLTQVKLICRGDEEKITAYLNQFLTLIPERLEKAKNGMKKKDRTQVRKVIHNMSPQIRFFGIPNVEKHISRLELECETMPLEDLQNIIKDISTKLQNALKEVNLILQQAT